MKLYTESVSKLANQVNRMVTRIGERLFVVFSEVEWPWLCNNDIFFCGFCAMKQFEIRNSCRSLKEELKRANDELARKENVSD